LFKTRILKFWF